ncbi:MAG: glycosyltransferase family 39 protein [Candidatus Glassbacteria bacterium]
MYSFDKKNISIILCLAAISAVAPDIAIVLLTVAILVIYFRRKSQELDDRNPYIIFIAAVALRLVIVSVFYLISIRQAKIFTIFGDSEMHFYESTGGFAVLSGKLSYLAGSLISSVYGYTILHWVWGAIYYIAGYSPFILWAINAVVGCLSAWLVYLITRKITGKSSLASVAMALTAFWPSNILWSVELLKEPILQLGLVATVYLFVDLITEKRWRDIVYLALLWYPLGHLRDYHDYLVLFSLLISAVLFFPKDKKTGYRILAGVALAGIVLLGPGRIKTAYLKANELIYIKQIGNITTPGSSYQFLPERFKPMGFDGDNSPMNLREMSIAYVRALYYYLGSPNPITGVTRSNLYAFPQMLLWYPLLLIFLPAGTLYLLRYKYRESGALIVFLLVLTSANALASGNVGTVFRQRDVLTPLYFVISSVGLFNLCGWAALKIQKFREAAELEESRTGA